MWNVTIDYSTARKTVYFISSASAYQKPPLSYPVTESTPLSIILAVFTGQDQLRRIPDEAAQENGFL
jgi:hypothetical protein